MDLVDVSYGDEEKESKDKEEAEVKIIAYKSLN